MTFKQNIADVGSSSNNGDTLPSPAPQSSGTVMLPAFCNCIILLKLRVQEMKGRLLLFAPLPSRNDIRHMAPVREVFLGLLTVTLVVALHMTWRQQFWGIVLNSVDILRAFVWIRILERWVTENVPEPGCGCEGDGRKVCLQLVDKQGQTRDVTESQVQTICRCLGHYNKSNDLLTKDQQTDIRAVVEAATQYESDLEKDVKRAVGLMAESRKESPVHQPGHHISPTLALEMSSVNDAMPGDDVSVIEQEPHTDPDITLPLDEPCFSHLNVTETTTSSEHSPSKVDVYERKQRGKICLQFLKSSLKISQLTPQNLEHTKDEVEKLERKLAIYKEPEGNAPVKRSLMKDLTGLHFTPQIQEQVFMCHKRHQDGLGDVMWQEWSRLATFSMYPLVPESGVWLMQLAAAGFYCPDQSSTVLRCAFCGVKVEIGDFRNRAPWEVHRAKSPSCCLVKGEAPNQSLEAQAGTANGQYTKTFFGPGVQNVEPRTARQEDKEQHMCINSPGQQTGLGGAAVHPDTPPSTRLNGSGHSTGPCSQSQAQQHHLASATTSISHPSQTEGGRTAPGSSEVSSSTDHPSGAQFTAFPPISPTSALCPSTGTGRGDTTGGSFTPSGTAEQSGSQTQDQAPGREPNQRPVEPQTSSGTARAQTASNSGTTGNQGNPQTFQTARAAERNQERTEPGVISHTEAAAAAGTSSDHPSPSASTNETVRQVVTYAQLGIYTQEPKRPDLAIASTRVRTFNDWPHSSTHPSEDMAEAGFYSVGVDDLVRCFYCKGGLKSWSTSLRPWVEHARFFPNCPFVGQVKGQEFIDVVQHLKEKQKEISEAEIEEELKKRQSVVTGKGFGSEDGAAETEDRMEGAVGGAEGGMTVERTAGSAMAEGQDDDGNQAGNTHLQKTADELEIQNQEIKNERICKICQVDDVSILFLPCGHLVSCSQCAPALRTCAVCRQRVKGRVRVSDDKNYTEEDTETKTASRAGDL